MHTWESAVAFYRKNASAAELRANYFDLPVEAAAERYAGSEEFQAVQRILGEGGGRRVLDVGAGNGITSYALAKAGWSVTALEPDPSDHVGSGAIVGLARKTGLPIDVLSEPAEALVSSGEFDAAIARQVLHHASSPADMLTKIRAAVRPGGVILTLRDHVVSRSDDVDVFRASHPLHALYGGENAFTLEEYENAFASAGLELLASWGPYDSIINFYPGRERDRQRMVLRASARLYGRLGMILCWSKTFQKHALRRIADRDHTPGRIYSFLARRPPTW